MLRDSTVVVAVVVLVRTRPRAIPLSMITMRKSIHGFLFSYMVMGLRMAALRAAGAPLLYQRANMKKEVQAIGYLIILFWKAKNLRQK